MLLRKTPARCSPRQGNGGLNRGSTRQGRCVQIGNGHLFAGCCVEIRPAPPPHHAPARRVPRDSPPARRLLRATHRHAALSAESAAVAVLGVSEATKPLIARSGVSLRSCSCHLTKRRSQRNSRMCARLAAHSIRRIGPQRRAGLLPSAALWCPMTHAALALLCLLHSRRGVVSCYPPAVSRRLCMRYCSTYMLTASSLPAPIVLE